MDFTPAKLIAIWDLIKQKLSDKETRHSFREREIWLVHFGQNLGREQNGVGEKFCRPVVIVKKFNAELFFAIPFSSRLKEGKFYFSISALKKPSVALLSQARTIDRKRLIHKLGFLDANEFNELRQKLKALVFEDF